MNENDNPEVDLKTLSDACLGKLFRVAFEGAKAHTNRGGLRMKCMYLSDIKDPRIALQRYIVSHCSEVLFRKHFGKGSIQNPFNNE